MTQEQLAVLLGVSRQSVTKWETERSHPEMDKLIQICAIFDCTIDELVTGDLTQRPIALCENTQPHMIQDIYGYDERLHEFARMMAVGIFIIMGSIALGLVLIGIHRMRGITGLQEEAIVAALFLAGISVGVAFIVPAFENLSSFRRMHPYVHDFYTEAQKQDARKEAGKATAAGALLIALGLLAPLAMKGTPLELLANGIMMILISTAAWFITYFGILGSRVDIDAYNKRTLCELEEERLIRSEPDNTRRRILLLNRRAHLKRGAVSNLVVLAGMLVSLLFLFAPLELDVPYATLEFFWLPLGASLVLSGTIGSLMDAFAKKE